MSLIQLSDSPVNRRTFLKLGTLSLLALPRVAFGSGESLVSKASSRSISFQNLHTDEKLSTVYWADGEYITGALADVNHILRDYRNGEIFEIVPRLLDTLCELRLRLETTEAFGLISGYRSPATNAMLRRQGH